MFFYERNPSALWLRFAADSRLPGAPLSPREWFQTTPLLDDKGPPRVFSATPRARLARMGRPSHDEQYAPHSHSWNLPDRLPPLLSESASEGRLREFPPTLLQQRSKRQTRHYATPSDPVRKSLLAASDGGAANASAILNAELRLKEVLATTHAWPPSRQRVVAALDALAEVSRLPSKFSSILPMLGAEFSTAVIARRNIGADGPPAQCYFELAELLRFDIRSKENDLVRMQQELQRVEREVTRREALIVDEQNARREVELALEACAKREAAVKEQLSTAHDEYELLSGEKQALEARLAIAEEKRRAKEEAAKEIQVSLFVEQRQLVEMKAMFRDHRVKAKADVATALDAQHAAERMMLRAHHAHLRAGGFGSETFQLAAKPVKEQIAAAVRWAETLNPVKAEASLQGSASDAPSSPRAAGVE